MAVSCKQGNEPQCSIIYSKLLDFLSYYNLFHQDLAPGS
jgi:hypothetical protein